ncbi:MAG TPA: hypothetical protein IAA26_14305 [Candidatus Blautia faecipullorum]|nr:hypothetical protein [Candidatus Blautia faecipullorum]
MDFKIVCATWIKEDDEKVLNALKASDKLLSAEELSVITNLPLRKVKHTLTLLKQQENFYNGRKKLLNE